MLWIGFFLFVMKLMINESISITIWPNSTQSASSFKKLNVIASTTFPIEIKDVPLTFRYIQIGIHSQKFNLTLSEDEKGTQVGSFISGNDIGLIVFLSANEVSSTVWIINRNLVNVTALVTVTLKTSIDPIPGGCNMEFPVEISPFLEIFYNRIETRVEYQHANIGYKRNESPPSCTFSAGFLSYNIYVYFLEENNFDENEYFKAITTMTNTSTIYSKAMKISPFEMNPKTRVTFMSYPGQGVIYNIIVSYEMNDTAYEAAYIPAVTYGCSFFSKVDGCGQLTSTFAKVLMIISAILGFAICLFGHRLFKTAVFCFGFLIMALISFILITKYTDIESLARDSLTVSCGILFGVMFLLFWCFLGASSVVVLFFGLVFGFLLMAVIYFTPLGNMTIFRNDINYWLIFCFGTLLFAVLSLPHPKSAIILSTAIIGSYVFIVAIDRFIVTTLSYIILNVVKRALFENLYSASNAYPFQIKDIILSIIWGSLATFGVCTQFGMQWNKPPLPPPPFISWRKRKLYRQQFPNLQYPPTSTSAEDNERRPLLFGRSRNVTYQSNIHTEVAVNF